MLLEVAGTLDRLGIEYLLGGSLASSVLGEPRSTVDIDLAVHLREARLRDFVVLVERDHEAVAPNDELHVEDHSSELGLEQVHPLARRRRFQPSGAVSC